eukprot:m.178275 g.178275  ORF g.178275 m.178275 type:complete len:200 (-) comp17979_c2_seq3:301-900(-)
MLLTDQSAHQTMDVHRRSRCNWRDNDLPAGFGADPRPMPSVASSTSSSSWGLSSATSPLMWIAGFGALVTIITKNILMGLVTGATAWVTWKLFGSPTCVSSPGASVRPAQADRQPPAKCATPHTASNIQESPVDTQATTQADAADSPSPAAVAPVTIVTAIDTPAAAQAETESSDCESDDGDDGFELISLNDLDAASRM